MKKEAYILINEYLQQALMKRKRLRSLARKKTSPKQSNCRANRPHVVHQRYTSGQSDNLLSYYYLLSKVKNCRAQENDLYGS